MMVRLALFPSAISTIVPSPKTLCLTLSPMSNFAMISLPISLSKKYQVNQVNHEVSKKHRTETTYNKPNILILIKIPCKYLVIIPPCNYLVKHLLQQFIYVFPPPKKPQAIHMAYIAIMVIITPISIYFISLSMVFLASTESAKVEIIR